MANVREKGNKQDARVEKIRAQYTTKEKTQFDELKELDAKVKHPVNTFSYIFGSIGAIIMGSGMSLVMTDVGASIGMENGMGPGVIIGCVGMFLALINYPMHKKMLSSRKKKYADRIVKLSDSIMEQK